MRVNARARAVGWESIVESTWQDVRYGIRMLRRSPGFAATAIAILALGIGATTAIFSLVNAVMLRTLPVHQPEQLVEPLSRYPGDPRMNGYKLDFYEYIRDHNHVFAEITGVVPAAFKVIREGADEETVDGEYAAGNLFSMLGLQPAIGRLIEARDVEAGAALVAVLNWSYWKSRFNLNPAVLGTQIKVNGVPATVVGVTPRAFVGLQAGVVPAVWLPATRPPGFRILARLKPGVSIEQAQAEMNVLYRSTLEPVARKEGNLRWLESTMEVESAAAGFSALRDRFGAPLQVLLVVVGLLLLIACMNVASMLLARGAARRQEMAVRVSLGAGRLRLARQVLTESLLLSLAGSALGVALAYVGADALLGLMHSGRLPPGWPQHLDIHVAPDQRVLLFTAGAAVVTGVLFGLAPAWSAFRSAPMSALRDIGSAGVKHSRRRFGQGLVATQVALSVVLLSAAGLSLTHLWNLRNVDTGFQHDSVLLVTLNPQGSGYNRTQLTVLYKDLLDRLDAIPGVRSATHCAVAPIDGGAASSFAAVDGFQEKPEDRRRLHQNWVGPRYFETLGTPFVAGRDFDYADANGPRVAIVNQAMARYYFGSGSPLGRRLTFERDTVPYEIVGVVGDAKYENLRDAAPRTVYLNAFQEGRIQTRFALRTDVNPTAVVPEVRRAVDDVLKTVRVGNVTTLSDQVNASLVLERVMATVSGMFGALGALLAAIGLYGLLAYIVTTRTNEIGVRIALGATAGDVTRMVLKGAFGLVCTGLVVGVPVAVASQRVAASLVPGLAVTFVLPIGVAGIIMIAVTLLAAYVPARRAARVQPMDALRRSA